MGTTRVEYKFRESEVICELTRDVKTKCVRHTVLSETCRECLKRNGIASERMFDRRTNANVTLHPCKEEGGKLQPFVRTKAKIGRNEQCTCGSGKKFKHCCGK